MKNRRRALSHDILEFLCAKLCHPTCSPQLREPKTACGTSSRDRFVVAPPPKDPDHRIMATTRTRRTYDHRLRRLIRDTGDVRLAIQGGVPRSTARDWSQSSTADVVTLDVVGRSTMALEREV